jgi:sortase (surface protein transpeptidase)
VDVDFLIILTSLFALSNFLICTFFLFFSFCLPFFSFYLKTKATQQNEKLKKIKIKKKNQNKKKKRNGG